MSMGTGRIVAAVTFLASATPALADCDLARASIADGEPQVLTLDEAANFLHLDEALLADAAAGGEVPGRRVAGEWRFVRAALMAWLAGHDEPADCFDAMQARGGPALVAPAVRRPTGPRERAPASPLRPAEMAATVGRQLPPVAPPAGQAPRVGVRTPSISGPAPASPRTGGPRPVFFGEEPEQDTAREIALRERVVLTRRGSFTLEAEIFYTRRDQNLSALAPFGVLSSNRRAEEVGAALTGRYGLRDDLQLTFGLPWSRRTDEVTASPPDGAVTIAESADSGFRGARLGLQHAVAAEGPGRPAVLVSAEGRIPLDGADTYGLGAGFSLVKSVDPATLFGSVSYLHGFNTGDRGALEPEDSFSVTAGFAFAMNDRLSLSSAVTGSFTSRSERGNVVRQSDESYNLRLALTGVVNENLYLEPWVSTRLNGPEASVTFGLSMPYRFAR